MRLLKLEANGELSLTNDITEIRTAYAILSHTWGEDGEEVTFDDLQDGSGKTKPGYKKLQFCGQQAARDGLQYFWVDTCCINKSSSTELSEAINSMFRWYRKAAICYVYLADVWAREVDSSLKPWEASFEASRWFTRGWTLQELVAPLVVEFFSLNGVRLGDKTSLEPQLSKITGIPIPALRGRPLSDFSFDERVLWARNRNTSREEDLAYSLLGIFDISISVIYGEGKENAFRRLKRELKYQLDEISQATSTSSHSTRFGKLKQILGGHSGFVFSIVFSPDSRLLASISKCHAIRLWDVATGVLQQTLQENISDVGEIRLVFSNDSRLLASAYGKGAAHLWDTSTGMLRKTVEAPDGRDYSVVRYSYASAFSHDSKVWMLVSVLDEQIWFWDITTGVLQRTFKLFLNAGIAVARFSPDSRMLATVTMDRTLHLWDIATGVLQQTLSRHDAMSGLIFSPDSRLLASLVGLKSIQIWDTATGVLQKTIERERGPLTFSHDSRLLASLINHKTVGIWDVTTLTHQPHRKLEEHSTPLCIVAFSPDSRVLASVSYIPEVQLWDVATGKLMHTFKALTSPVHSVEFSPDSRLLAFASEDGTVRLWNVS